MHHHRTHRRHARGETRGDHFGGFGHGRGWGRHGGGRHRPFEQGDLRLLVLALIAEKPRHGYELIKEIESRMGGVYAPSPGVIYPLLTMLEEMGLARLSAEDGGKKLYAATPEGEAELAANKASVETIFSRIDGAREMSAGGRAPQIVRAIENFRLALRLRMERGAINEAEALAIAAAIDAAAQAIERT
jgi:DNA-binding PadR family transcriptional regulator